MFICSSVKIARCFDFKFITENKDSQQLAVENTEMSRALVVNDERLANWAAIITSFSVQSS